MKSKNIPQEKHKNSLNKATFRIISKYSQKYFRIFAKYTLKYFCIDKQIIEIQRIITTEMINFANKNRILQINAENNT